MSGTDLKAFCALTDLILITTLGDVLFSVLFCPFTDEKAEVGVPLTYVYSHRICPKPS